MIFSKTFGYALRGILYVAMMQDQKRYVQIEEMADRLVVPRHFLSKIMKGLVKEGLLISVKGPYGGYTLTDDTLQTPLLRLEALTDGLGVFNNCVLHFRACNAVNPCPLHGSIEKIKSDLHRIMEETTIGSLLRSDKERFISSIASYEFSAILGKMNTNERNEEQ